MDLKNENFVLAYDWLRKNKDVEDQADLAAKIGVGTNTISHIMTGKTSVSDKTLQKLNDAFGDIFNMLFLRGRSKIMLYEDYVNSSQRIREADASGDLHLYLDALEAENKEHSDSIPKSVSVPVALLESIYSELHTVRQELAEVRSQLAALEAKRTTPRGYRATTRPLSIAAEP